MTIIAPSSPWHCNNVISTDGRIARPVREPKEPLDLEIKVCLLNIFEQDNRQEICGLLSSDEDIFIVKNTHLEPINNFYMDKDSFKDAVRTIVEERGERITGIFHTHPNNQPWPSPRDIVGWPNPDLGWRYFIVTHKEVLEWELVSAE